MSQIGQHGEADIKSAVRAFIADNFLFGQSLDGLADTDSLVESGTVDSTGILELIGFLEQRYEIKVEDDEMVPANLDSVDKVCRFLMRKAANGGRS